MQRTDEINSSGGSCSLRYARSCSRDSPHTTSSRKLLSRMRATSSSRDRGDDADLVAFLHRRIEVLQEANVLIVQINIHEAIELIVALEQPRFDAGGFGLQRVENFADAGA